MTKREIEVKVDEVRGEWRVEWVRYDDYHGGDIAKLYRLFAEGWEPFSAYHWHGPVLVLRKFVGAE